MSDKYQKKIDASKVKQVGDAGLLYKDMPSYTLKINTSNFLFLKQHDPIFYQLASVAEQFFTVDPNTTMVKIRLLAEALVKDMASQAKSLFSLAGTLEAAKKRVDKLTQSILAKAFRGELVEQDPDDESAEDLLERIRSEG